MALVSAVKKIGKPTMTADLAGIDQDTETPEDEVYQDELEGTGHVSDADAGADAATLEDLDSMCAQVYLLVVEVMQHGRVRKRARHSYGNLPDMSTTIPYLMLVCMKWN